MHLSHFVRQKSYEKVEYVLRRHWVTFLSVVFSFLTMLLLPIAVYYGIQYLFPDLLEGPIITPLLILFGSGFFLYSLLFFYIQFIDYYLDLWIITNDRIIDTEQKGLFAKTITELELFQIQDVTTNTNGILATIFKYGDLVIATASNTSTIIFHDIPNPDFIRQELVRLAAIDRSYHSHANNHDDSALPIVKK